jgi:hypothetical protein
VVALRVQLLAGVTTGQREQIAPSNIQASQVLARLDLLSSLSAPTCSKLIANNAVRSIIAMGQP